MKRIALLSPRSAGSRLVLCFVTALLIGLVGCASTEEKKDDASTGSEFSDAGATNVVEETDITEINEWIDVPPVYFDFDKSNIRPDAVDTLRTGATALKATGARIVIAGNTDNRGSEEYNLALGERRAASVQRYLENLGVPSDQLTIVSYGELRPAAQGNTPAAWALNRRADFTLAD